MFNELELWQELLSNQSVLDSQYELLGKADGQHKKENEIVIMLK